VGEPAGLARPDKPGGSRYAVSIQDTHLKTRFLTRLDALLAYLLAAHVRQSQIVAFLGKNH
jgi:hypothetical protein